MARNAYALLALGKARSPWLGDLSAWTTSGAIPATVTKCLSTAEVRQRLGSLQPSSALIIDGDFLVADPELIRIAERANVATFVIPGKTHTPGAEQATVVFDGDLSPTALLSALANHASVLPTSAASEMANAVEQASNWTGKVIAVCGPGGTGASTMAMALAQGLGGYELDAGLVALVDMTRNSELAMLHEAPEFASSLEDLIESHRSRRAASDEIRSLASTVTARNYSLILGTRKPSAWAALPTPATSAALEGLQRSFRYVVVDITADFEGEGQSGSADTEERNFFARNAAGKADAVLVVGGPGLKGSHSLARTIRDLLDLGVEVGRILPVVNRAPKSPLVRSEQASAVVSLVHRRGIEVAVNSPIFLGDRKIESALRDGAPLDKRMVKPLTNAVKAVLDRQSPMLESEQPQPVEPGSLGTQEWAMGE